MSRFQVDVTGVLQAYDFATPGARIGTGCSNGAMWIICAGHHHAAVGKRLIRHRRKVGQYCPPVLPIIGPEFTMRVNLYRSAQLNVSARPGFSSAQVMTALEEVFKQTMPSEMGYTYTGMSFQEKKAMREMIRATVLAQPSELNEPSEGV